MSNVVPFPRRRQAAVLVLRDEPGGWLVVVREHSWAFGSRREALAEARRLAAPFRLPIREVAA